MATPPFKADYQGELMKNYVCQAPVGAGKAFSTLLDADNNPLIFSIGEDNRLRLIRQTDNEAAPYQLTELTTTPVHTFAVAQNPQNLEIRVAYSTFIDGKSRLYYSRLRGNDSNTFKTGAEFEWVEHVLDNPAAEINRIEANHEYIMFSTQSRNSEAFYYVAEFGSKHKRFTLPEYGYRILDFKVGSYNNVRGTYLLYNVGEKQTLLFKEFLGDDDVVKRFSTEGLLTAIDLVRQPDGKDQLLVCGDSVVLHESVKKRKTLIAHRGTRFFDIQASQYEGNTSVWVIEKTDDQQSSLVFLTDCFFDQETQQFRKAWTTDLPFMPDIHQFSCVKGTANGNHLVVIDKRNQLQHLTQDPSTSFWKQRDIAVESLKEILEFPCYTTRFVVEDEENGIPVTDQLCYVSASSQTDVIINGSTYQLNNEHPAAVKTDVMGALTIICPVNDELQTPVFYIGYNKQERLYVINPAHLVDERMRSIKNAADFKEAKTDDGESLWGKDQRPADRDLDDAAKIIQQLLDAKQDMLNDEIANLPGAIPQTERVHPDGIWGVTFEKNKATYLGSSEAQKLMEEQEKGFHPVRWVGHAIGSLFRYIKSVFGKLRSFIVKVVNRVTTFVLNIAGEIFHFIIDTLEKIFPFLEYVFNAIGLVFKTLLHWLGRLIGWGDIWENHKIISRITTNGMQSIGTHVDASVNGWKNTLDHSIHKLQDELQKIKDENLPDDTERNQNKVVNTIKKLFISPLFSWPMYQVLHSGMMKKIYDLTLKKIKLLDEFVKKQAETYQYIKEFVDDQLNAIIAFAVNPRFSTQAMLALFEPILTRVLTTAETLINGLLDFLSDAIHDMQHLLGDTMEIPFLTPMYNFVSRVFGGGKGFSFIDGFSLMLSVPLTILHKILNGGRNLFDGILDGFGERAMFDRLWVIPAAAGELPATADARNENRSNQSEWDKFVDQYKYFGGLIGSYSAAINGFFALAKGEPMLDAISLCLSSITYASIIPVATSAGVNTPEKQAALSLRLSQYVINATQVFVVNQLGRYNKGARAKEKNIIAMVLSSFAFGTNLSANVLNDPGALSWTGQMMVRGGSLVTCSGNIAKKNPYVLLAGSMLNLTGCSCNLANAANKPISHGTYD